MPTDTVSIAELIAQNHITMSASRTDSNPNIDDSRSMDHWKCTLRFARSRMTLTFSQGYGHHGAEPKLAGVLDCLASDARTIDNTRDFDDWCSELGCDPDSRTAEKTYKATKHQTTRLRNFLGDSLFDQLVYHTEQM